MKINGILHIGAHNCEELKSYKKYGVKNDRIIWIEANPRLVEKNKKADRTRIIKNFVCCETNEGKTKLNIANNGQSSSILELGTHKDSYPSITYNDFVDVNNGRIDTMYERDGLPNDFANFLNIDIQGAELLALRGMGELIGHFEYVYLEVNREYVYKECALVTEIDDYLSRWNFKRIETEWTDAGWGDALYMKKYDVLKNVRCSEEIWSIHNITFDEALKMAKDDPRVKALHWYNKNGNQNAKGWYQGAGGDIGTISNVEWDTIPIKSTNTAFDIGANVGLWSNANVKNYDKIIAIEASPRTFERLNERCTNDKIELLNYVICDNDCQDIIFFQADADHLSTLNENWLSDSKSRFYGQKYDKITCKSRTIDSLIIEYGKPELIKIDVEGGEYECMKSLSQKVDCLCFEWASETNDITYACLDYLHTLGFSLFYIQKNDAYTFVPVNKNYKDLLSIKQDLSKMIPKKDWGMMWCK